MQFQDIVASQVGTIIRSGTQARDAFVDLSQKGFARRSIQAEIKREHNSFAHSGVLAEIRFIEEGTSAIRASLAVERARIESQIVQLQAQLKEVDKTHMAQMSKIEAPLPELRATAKATFASLTKESRSDLDRLERGRLKGSTLAKHLNPTAQRHIEARRLFFCLCQSLRVCVRLQLADAIRDGESPVDETVMPWIEEFQELLPYSYRRAIRGYFTVAQTDAFRSLLQRHKALAAAKKAGVLELGLLPRMERLLNDALGQAMPL